MCVGEQCVKVLARQARQHEFNPRNPQKAAEVTHICNERQQRWEDHLGTPGPGITAPGTQSGRNTRGPSSTRWTERPHDRKLSSDLDAHTHTPNKILKRLMKMSQARWHKVEEV